MNPLISGLLTGAAFGFLLQKAGVIRYDRQLGALRLMDMTIVKFMLSAVLTGMTMVYALKDLGYIELRIMPAAIGANVAGGLLFGLGWGLIGYCPATSLGALGEGRFDAFWGILGMLVGAGLYAEAYPAFSRTILTWGKIEALTLPQALGINHWFIIPAFIAGGLLLFRWFEKRGF